MPKQPTCSSLKEHLWDYCAHKTQNTTVQTEIEQHLLHCEDCREQVALYRLLQAGTEQIKTTPVPTSTTNWTQLRAQLETASTPQRRRRGIPLFWHFGAVFATACMGVVFWLARPKTEPQIVQAPLPPIYQEAFTTKPTSKRKHFVKKQTDLPQKVVLVKETPKKNLKPRVMNAGYRVEELKRKPQNERRLVLQRKKPLPVMAQKEPDGIIYGINYNVDGEMPLAQTRRTIEQGRESLSLERVSAGRYTMGSVPTTRLASQGDRDKELPAW